MALLLVYMIVAAQIERFLELLEVMSAPMAPVGIVPALLLTGTTSNIQSLMGLVMPLVRRFLPQTNQSCRG